MAYTLVDICQQKRASKSPQTSTILRSSSRYSLHEHFSSSFRLSMSLNYFPRYYNCHRAEILQRHDLQATFLWQAAGWAKESELRECQACRSDLSKVKFNKLVEYAFPRPQIFNLQPSKVIVTVIVFFTTIV